MESRAASGYLYSAPADKTFDRLLLYFLYPPSTVLGLINIEFV
jgi:hypothetical protein